MKRKSIIWITAIILAIAAIFIFRSIGLGNNDAVASGDLINNPKEVVTEEEDYEESLPVYTSIPIDKEWEFEFEKELDEGTVNTSNIQIVNQKMNDVVEIDPRLSDDGKMIIIPAPMDNYEKGATYEIHLSEEIRYTSGDYVESAYAAVFIIERDEVEEAKVNDDLIFIDNEDLVVEDENTIQVDQSIKENLQKGDILVLPSSEYPDGIAVKAVNVKENASTYQIEVAEPKFTEVFDEMNIYKSYPITEENFELNPKLEGVSVEKYAMLQTESMMASASSEFKLPKMKFQSDGLLVTFEDFELERGKEKLVFDGSLSLAQPRVVPDIKYNMLKNEVERFNIVLHTGSTIDMELTNSFSVGKEKSKKLDIEKKFKTNKEKIALGKLTIPTPVTGLFIQGTVNMQISFDITGEVILSVTFEMEDERGILYDGSSPEFVQNTTGNVESKAEGRGKADAQLGPSLEVGITAFGVLGAGIETFVSGKGEYEFYTANDYACHKGMLAPVLEGSATLDLFILELANWTFAEKTFPPNFSMNNCQAFQNLVLDIEDITIAAGESMELSINGNYIDMSNDEEENLDLRYLENLKITPSNKDALKVTNVDGKWLIEAAPETVVEEATLIIEYEEPADGIYGFEDKADSVEIPVHIDSGYEELTNAAASQIVNEHLNNFSQAMYRLQDDYALEWQGASWFENPDADRTSFNQAGELLKQYQVDYATENYFDERNIQNHLLQYFVYLEPSGVFSTYSLDTRFEIVEQSRDSFVITTVQLEDQVGYYAASSYRVRFVLEDGRWKIDREERLSTDSKPLNISITDLENYYAPENVELLDELTIDGEDYIVYRVDGVIYARNTATSEFNYDVVSIYDYREAAGL